MYPYEQTGLRLRNGMLPIVDGHVWEAALRFLVSNLFDILMFCFDLLMFFWFPIFGFVLIFCFFGFRSFFCFDLLIFKTTQDFMQHQPGVTDIVILTKEQGV